MDGTINPGAPTKLAALREVVIDIDRQVSIDAEGLPTCGARRLADVGSGEARRLCREAIVGHGTANVALAPEGSVVTIPLTFFNAGVQGDTTTVVVHSLLPTEAPEVLLATVKVNEQVKGQFGSQAVVRIPPIAGGSGALSSFSFELGRRFGYEGEKRSYLAARCHRGRLEARFSRMVFKNEVNTPGVAPTTELIGTLFKPCTPTG